MVRIWLIPLALASGGLHIHAEYQGRQSRIYLLKPLTTSLIIITAIVGQDPISGVYKISIIVGLIFSLIGDVFLMLPEDRFVAGLVSFLLAHISYLIAFTGDARNVMTLWLAAPFLLYALVFYVYLAPDLGKQRIPVLIYTIVISSMAWAAWGRWLRLGGIGSMLAAIGAVLFVISDSSLAYNRFHKEHHWGQLLTLSSYYLAQMLIAWSV